MRLGLRRPSLKRRLSARSSLRRSFRHSLGFKAPRGLGWLTNPRRAVYNRIYSRTSVGCAVLLALGGVGICMLLACASIVA